MLTIRLVEWGVQGSGGLSVHSVIFCISVSDLFGNVHWFVWRSHAEFLDLWLSLQNISDSDIEIFPPSSPENCPPRELQKSLESWLTYLLNSRLENGRDLLRCFLTTQANFTPPRMLINKANSMNSVYEPICSNICHWEDFNNFDE